MAVIRESERGPRPAPLTLNEPGLELAIAEARLARLEAERWEGIQKPVMLCRHPSYECTKCGWRLYPKKHQTHKL